MSIVEGTADDALEPPLDTLLLRSPERVVSIAEGTIDDALELRLETLLLRSAERVVSIADGTADVPAADVWAADNAFGSLQFISVDRVVGIDEAFEYLLQLTDATSGSSPKKKADNIERVVAACIFLPCLCFRRCSLITLILNMTHSNTIRRTSTHAMTIPIMVPTC